MADTTTGSGSSSMSSSSRRLAGCARSARQSLRAPRLSGQCDPAADRVLPVRAQPRRHPAQPAHHSRLRRRRHPCASHAYPRHRPDSRPKSPTTDLGRRSERTGRRASRSVAPGVAGKAVESTRPALLPGTHVRVRIGREGGWESNPQTGWASLDGFKAPCIPCCGRGQER
jgi:hypothetical protein